LARQPLQPPKNAALQLRALQLRHASFHQTRTRALKEILDALDSRSIRPLLLKGAALAWTIYPAPALRPMGDIDLLTRLEQAEEAQETLRGLGYDAPLAQRRFSANAHHLPAANRPTEGFNISVEIHRDALSRDIPQSLTMNSLSEPPRAFTLDDRAALALGHIDMLRHLCHHALEPFPGGRVRLIGIVDLLRYARLFRDETDWERIEQACPFVLNVLRCMHYIVPLPRELHDIVAPPTAPSPDGAGETMGPLSVILAAGRPKREILQELFQPPAWWLHAAYNSPPESSLRGARLVRHPLRVARWFAVRSIGF
ncbi:MAG: nucleotidyltransferase family protein, partial [Pseudomonadota bacterium]|nr:nucleotidyltransferase family protein [Pseudomonadota bacterium]